ncbi:TPA: DUF72 domain-containing protein [Candidatus Bathyarchaeota archaeon]|nr:DUF72 domain-containing protein [Candidatus Bathyarchaeota archaeon]
MVIKIGCCGYPVSMRKYYETFDLVELNNTFYRYPRRPTVEGWRKKAPENFEFTVKAHQDISHNHRLRLEDTYEAFEKMKRICEILHSHILLIQTPASFKPDLLEIAEKFFRGIERNNLTLVWETRGLVWERDDVRERLRKVLEDLDVPHVTDPFRTMPVYVGEVAYFRLHGLGERMYYYQYTDMELRMLFEKIKPLDSEGRSVYVLFNNLSMFEDALRLKNLMDRGNLPSLTSSVGIESVKAVIIRARYPLTKSELISKLGWRLIEMEKGIQVRLEEILKSLPSKIYNSPEDILQEIERLHLLK